MENNEMLTYKWVKGVKEVKPTNEMVKSWLFTEKTEEEANLANAMALVAKKKWSNC
ncbi:MAG: hypothetical protein ABIP51_16695 [Bacteroidia bacterium]